MRNIFALHTQQMTLAPVDTHGLVLGEALDDVNLVYTTPSHQFPTTVTMPLERRMGLLKKASEKNFIIIEDDYEFETNYVNEPCPALKSLDDDGRVIYVGSLSKTLFPGLAPGLHGGAARFHRRGTGAAPVDGAPCAKQQPAHGRAVSLARPS